MVMNSNLIIETNDPRYGKLGHIWKKYSYESVWYSEGGRASYYYIPPELLLEEYEFRDKRKISKSPEGDWDNWIHCMKAAQFLEDLCGLTSQEYFDLVILHINSRSDRPRCPICRKSINFNNIKVGYGGGGGNAEWDTRTTPCCSMHCASIYRHRLGAYEELYDTLNNDPVIRTKNEMSSFIGKGTPEEFCYFYITWTNKGLFKFGGTKDIVLRAARSCEDKIRGFYLNPHILLSSTREEVAYLEAGIKLEFGGREYLSKEEISKFNDILRELLANRPIANPFD